MSPHMKDDPTAESFAFAQPRAITKPLTEAQLRVRDLILAECRRIAANLKRPVKGCK